MSTELNPIHGKAEYIERFEKVGYKDASLEITSFYGGKQRGTCLQLSITEDHIQLTKDEVTKLKDEITQWLLSH